CLRASGARSLVRSRQVRGPLRVNPNPSGSRSWEARALYPHDAEALPGRCLHYDPALQAIHHRRAKLFDAPHFGRNIVGLNVDVRAALMLDPLDFDEHLVRTSFQQAVIVAAHWMTKIYRTAEGGSPEAGGLVQVCGLAVDEHGAQAGMVLHLALFTIARRRQGDNAENARTDPFRDGFNCSAFAGRVTAFKYNNDFRPFSLDPILKSAQLDLKLVQVLFIFLALHLLGIRIVSSHGSHLCTWND